MEEGWTSNAGMHDCIQQGIPPSIQKGRSVKKKSIPMPDVLSDPKCREFFEAFTQFQNKAKTLPLDEVRKLNSALYMSKGSVVKPVKQIEHIEILGLDQHRIPLRIYSPEGSAPRPVLVYFHKGGWVFGNIEESDPFCRTMANIFGTVVVSVEYRLAPEDPFPAALQDCYDAVQWVDENIDSFGGDHANISVCGESAGANLAAAVALLAKDKQEPSIRSQILFYPPVTAMMSDDAYDTSPDQYFLTKEAMKWFWSMYLKFPGDAGNKYASLNLAVDVKGVAPALVITAEYDPLHQEGEQYALQLQKGGVCVVSKRFPGVLHGFLDHPMYEESQKLAWLREIKQMIQKLHNLTDDHEEIS
jgi:acetyl esterase